MTEQPAGQGVDDEEMVEQVARQTSSDLAVEEAFEREAGGADADRPADSPAEPPPPGRGDS